MFLKKYKVVGILGGMGPDATMDLYNHIIRMTPAQQDQDHIPALIFSNPKIPDRTESIMSGKTKKIIQYLQESAHVLEKGGADFIVIPCNTAHVFYKEITKAVSIPVYHIAEETVKYITSLYRSEKYVGLLGTIGTLKTNLYQGYLQKKGITAVVPDDEIMEQYVMKAIYGIKAGRDTEEARKLLIHAVTTLPERAQNIVIMGCTEIPLAFKEPLDSTVMINPTEILAETAVRESNSRKRL